MGQKKYLSSAIICVLFVSSILFIGNADLSQNSKNQEPFLVGLTYGGNSTQEAKVLIGKVSNYTNLFVLQSGLLKENMSAVYEVGDYAVSKGLHFAAYYDVLSPAQDAMWMGTAKERWGDMFAGVYLGDEPCGKMLDSYTYFELTRVRVPMELSDGNVSFYERSGISVLKYVDGKVEYRDGEGYTAAFYPDNPDSIISVKRSNLTSTSKDDPNNSSLIINNLLENLNTTIYYPNGSITVSESITNTTNRLFKDYRLLSSLYDLGYSYEVLRDNLYTMENGSDRIAQEETYQQIKSKNPMSDCNGAAKLFVNKTSTPIVDFKKQWNITKGDFPVFTADYVLYWWDYKSGYDMVLAELGWNNTVAQEIALVRGAANLQGKSWGTILTWKYTQAPYLADGEEIFNQMKTSYENGAQYVILFNFAEDMTGPYGTLQEEHFQALERFWNEVVQNPAVIHGGVKAQAVLVLPENYGWGMRNPNDKIWGIWEPDNASSQIWTQVQSKLEQYGTQLDIVYSDSAFPAAGRYSNVYVLNKTP